MSQFPKIKVDFVIEGKNLDIEKLTKMINIFPTRTRNIDDWPETVKNLSTSARMLRKTTKRMYPLWTV